MSKGIDHIGMWTWGGRVFNWQKYLENMQAVGMDSVVLWHYHAPANALDIQEYAAELGIEVIWGFNWGWNDPVCLNSAEDSALWRERVLTLIENEYEPLSARAICFQTGGTEFGGSCRLHCPACAAAAQTGVGPLYMKFVTPIIAAVRQRWPQLKLYANVHLGGMTTSYQALADLPPEVSIMYEDIPGPAHHIEIPFAYDWGPDDPYQFNKEDPTLRASTLDMVRNLTTLRGPTEDVAFILKGFPCHWGGHDPMLLEDFDLAALDAVYRHRWDRAEKYCTAHLDQALRVFRVIAEAPAARKMVLLLVEHGLWEWKRSFAAVLITEALRNPFREPDEIIKATRTLAE